MRILVTGGLGFIGSHLVDRLVADGHDVAILDAKTYAAGKLRHAIPLFPVTLGAGQTQAALDAMLLFRPTHIAHLAAETHVCASIDYPARFMQSNAMGAMELLEAARLYGEARVLHVSTDEVYGDTDYWSGHEFYEDAPLRPSNPYSASKAAGELLARSYRRTYGMDVVVARPCNNYGPRQYPEKLIPRCIERARKGLPIEIHGDGANIREWLHVSDCVEALSLLLERGDPGEAYNIGSAWRCSNRDIAEVLAAKTGAQVVHVADRPGNDRRYAINSDKLRAMDWSPQVTLDDGLRALLNERAAA